MPSASARSSDASASPASRPQKTTATLARSASRSANASTAAGPPSPSNGMSLASLAIAAPSFVSARAANPLSARRCQRWTQPAPRPVLAAITRRPSGSRTATAAQSQASPSAVARLIASSTRSRSSATPASRLAAARTRSAMAARRRSDARCVVSSSAAAAVLTRSSTPPAAPSSGLGGFRRRARDLRAELDERALQRPDERDEAEPALDAAGDLPLQHERGERCAVRIAQRALERLERLLAARAHARERHALGSEHLVRDERAALEQRRAQLRHQRETGRLGLGSLVDHRRSA